jgi:type VI secretion system protein VasD
MDIHFNRNLFCLFIFSLLLIGLTSCASAPKKQYLGYRVSATADVNPDLENRPSPIMLHVLELTDIDAFNRVDFFALTQNDVTALGSALLSKTEIILTPGSSKENTLELNPQTSYLGFVAGYRDMDNSQWRVSQQIIPGTTERISIQLDKNRISIAEINQ